MSVAQPKPPSKKPGRIYTFYSYKGGTGRTMALANVAWILASAGKRVLTIDWDLEAPGLHRYFHPFLSDPEATSGEGLIEFLLEFVAAAHQGSETIDAEWFKQYANILPFAVSLDWAFGVGGALHMVSAGRQDGGYATRVTSFDWVSFYKQLGGGIFLEAVKTRLRDEYDYILIDSRTGLSDTSGICSVQMPDDLVCCFTLNSQSINGASSVAESAFSQRLRPTGEPGLRVWPVATRVELSEREKLDNAREIARLKFAKFISRLPRAQRVSYMASVEVLYQPYFAYEEILATIADRRHQTGSLLGSFETITRWITDGDVAGLPDSIDPEAETKRREALGKFTRSSSPKPKIYIDINDVTCYGAPDRLPEMSQFLTQMVRAFGPENVLLKPSAASFFEKAAKVNVSVGTRVEAEVILSVDSGQDKPIRAAIGFSSPGNATKPGTGTPLYALGIDERSFSELQTAIEELSLNPRTKRYVSNPDDPQKGRWGGSFTANGKLLSANVFPITDDWFNVALQVSGSNLTGDVIFYLHPTFQPNIVTVVAEAGVAKVEVMAFGAFTVGAAADDGATFLELDLAQNASFPKTFLER